MNVSVSSNSPCIAANCGRVSSSALLLQPSIAQNPAPTWSQEDGMRIAQEVQKRLARLTNYGVFDWITFGFHGKTVVVKGYASRPILKKDIDNALKGIPGVESVDNQVEVLPNSPNDDRIRRCRLQPHLHQPRLAQIQRQSGRHSPGHRPGPQHRPRGRRRHPPPRPSASMPFISS